MGMKAISVAAGILVACGGSGPHTGDDTTPPDDAATTFPDANVACTGTTVTDVSGPITADAMWSGTINLTAAANVPVGVTLTMLPGTLLLGATAGKITVAGKLDIQGTKACPVTARPSDATWSGIVVASGGELDAHYLDQTGGSILLQGTATATIIDSRMARTTHDFLVMSGGTLDLEYSWMGVEAGQPDTTHCDLHFAGTVTNTLKVTHNNISTAVYGLMFYNGMGADFTYNNWFGNLRDIDIDPTRQVNGDFSFGWFEKGAPSLVGVTVNNLATDRLTDAGPR